MQAAHATGKDRKRRRAPGGSGKIRTTGKRQFTATNWHVSRGKIGNHRPGRRRLFGHPRRGHARSRAERCAQQNPQGLRRCGRGPAGRADPTRLERTHAPSREPNAARARRRLDALTVLLARKLAEMSRHSANNKSLPRRRPKIERDVKDRVDE